MEHDREDGAECLVRKKAKVERRTLSIASAADASKGPRDSMEDAHTVRDDLKFYAVYDGHGGAEAAKILTEILHEQIIQSKAFENGKIEDAILEGFINADKHILQESMDNKWDSGTTAVVALIHGTKLYIANCGDSEAVLGRRKHKSIKGEASLSFSTDATPKSSPPTPRKSLSPLSFSLPEGLPLIPPPSPDHFLPSSTPPKISFVAREGAGSPLSLGDSSGIAPFSNLSLASPRKNDNVSLVENSNGNDNQTNNHNNTQNNTQNNNQNNNQTNNHNNNNKHTNGNGKHHSSPRTSRTNHHKKENGHAKAKKDNGSECLFTSLSDNITQYLKDNPSSFFCQKSALLDELFDPIVLTCCHRPTSEEEVQRISAAGGEIAYGMVSGELAVTRSFGDINFKHPRNKGSADFVSVHPHINVVDLQPQDEFLVLASDGLWDVLSHKEAIDMIAKCATDSQHACEELVDEALRKNSFDNVTVVVLSFKWSV